MADCDTCANVAFRASLNSDDNARDAPYGAGVEDGVLDSDTVAAVAMGRERRRGGR